VEKFFNLKKSDKILLSIAEDSCKGGQGRSENVASVEDCLCTGQSSQPIVTEAPGPRREPGTVRTARKGPDHYPSWEVVAYNATIVDGSFPDFPFATQVLYIRMDKLKGQCHEIVSEISPWSSS
jgi:hypothetical protein